MVYFDFIKQESITIPENIREELKKHLVSLDDLEKENKKEMKENEKKVDELDYINSDL